jgi:hypothetical protein
MSRHYDSHGYEHDRRDNAHRSHRSHRGSWKWWAIGITAAVIYVNSGGSLDFGEILGGTGGGTSVTNPNPAPAPAPVNNGGGWKAPCTQYFRGGC